MTSETDLSTADLAQPVGAQHQDRADVEQRRGGEPADANAEMGERTYETAGNRAAEGMSDHGTEEPALAGAGSTREDARGDAPYPGRSGTGDVSSGMVEGDTADRETADRGMTDQGMGDRGMGDRGMGDRGMTDQGMGERGGQPVGGDVALLDPTDAEGFRQRWGDAQARFVDDPREAVQTADGLVAELMQTLASSFSEHKGELEAQWQSGGDPDTEELRQALQRYRSFFDRLLSA
jgi:hypothetical protein